MQNFEQDVYPTLVRIVNRVFADPDLASIALVLAWFAWDRHQQAGNPEIEPRLFAASACRRVKAGRDLPGIRSKFRDVWDRRTRWDGAAMEGVKEPRPGPLEGLIAVEEMELFLAGLNPRLRAMADLILEDQTLGTGDLAERLNLSAARISQMRRELKAQHG